ncbi:MAG TPA: peptidoglycan-binding domain-containing protein [Candidatus Paceibacterota bacterium]
MKSYLQSGVVRFASVAVGVAMLLSVATPVAAQTQSQIDALLAQIAALQAQLLALQAGSSTSMSCNFTVNLKLGMSHAEVRTLQQFLNTHGAQVAASGAGSPGNETMYFGALTRAAVINWQNANAASVLTPAGLTAGTGFWGAFSRAHANSQCTVAGPGPVTPPTTGGMATVTAAAQPANGLAVQGAARIPFTKFTVTAGASAVTINSVEVERTGLADDDAFSDVVLLDSNGMQIGIGRTLNSNHRATIGEAVTVPAGTSMTFTVAANTAADNGTNAGQVASFSVVGLNTNGTVAGSFPITGASHTINASLVIGSVTINTSGLVNTAATIDIGEADIIHSGVRLTAGSSENLRLWSIRWNNAGSAAPSDLGNVVVKVDGTSYPTTVSSDGKYYTATFGNGIVVAKGNTVEITISAVALGGPNRTIKFDLYRRTDVAFTGELFGYGITPPAGSGTAAATTQEFTSGTPWYDGITKTINAGTITTVSKSNSVPAQNIAENLSDQPLGGFEIDVKGEAITVQSSIFHFAISGSGGDVADIDNITLTNLTTGLIVAGPKDATAGATNAVTFTDSITYPTGKSTYVLKGKLGTDFTSDQTVIASTTPDTDNDWTTVTGQITGNSITLSNTIVTMNTMTVKVATATISVNSLPAAQNVVVGTTGFTFAKFNVDATASGEDIRLNSFEITADTPTEVTADSLPVNCFAYSSAGTRLNSSAVNPTEAEQSFTLATALVVKKGTIEAIEIKCDVPSNLTSDNSFRWTLTAGTNAWSGTGATSGQTVTFGFNTANGNTMTFKGAGTFTVIKDSSSPSYIIMAANQSNAINGVLRFSGSNEEVTLKKVALQLTNTASSTNATVTGVSLWDGATKVGSGLFTGSATTTQITLDQTVTIPKDGDKKLTVKFDIAAIGTGQSGVQGALVAVDYDANGQAGTTEGTGAQSGTTVLSSSTSTSADTAFDGVRVFKGYPTFAKVSMSPILSNGSDKPLMRYSITANGNDVGIAKFTVRFATTTATVSASSVNIHCFTNSSFTSACSGLSADGQVDDTDKTSQGVNLAEIYAENSAGTASALQIPVGQTYYFEVRGTVSGAAAGTSIATYVEGDAAYPLFTTDILMASSTGIDNDQGGNDDFIWSPNAATTSALYAEDWTNGYQVVGLPSGGISDSLSL